MNQETSADYSDDESEISLLDLLHTVVSNWRLLTVTHPQGDPMSASNR